MTDDYRVTNLMLRWVSEHDGPVEVHHQAIPDLEPNLVAKRQFQRTLAHPDVLVAVGKLEATLPPGGISISTISTDELVPAGETPRRR